ncbi:MAG: glutamine amidotransferase [Actinomycetia bacterium]|nr:glutamine amidotransferase [Actinomycetes bacterium]
MQLTVAHLYPDQLNIYADRGNMAVLERRAAWRGIELTYTPVPRDGQLPPRLDLVYIGGGQDREQGLIAPDLARHATRLRACVEDGAALLAVCGGYQLLGRFYRDRVGSELPGVGLFPHSTVAGETRMIGDVLLESDLEENQPRPIAGFENHAGRTTLEAGALPLGRVVRGFGNNGTDGLEGCRLGNAIGTYLHGPLLPRNPWLADWLLSRALEHATGKEVSLDPLGDEVEALAFAVAAKRARSRSRRFGRRRSPARMS